MNSFQNQQAFNPPHLTNPPPRIFGGSELNGSPTTQSFGGGPYFTDDHVEGLEECTDAKRRRIARVWEPQVALSSAI